MPINPVPILLGRTAVTRTRALYSRCHAYSRTFNPRNLEFYWYPTWNQQLFEVVGDIPNLVVAAQFPISVDPHVPHDPEVGEEVDEVVAPTGNADGEEEEEEEQEEQEEEDGDPGGESTQAASKIASPSSQDSAAKAPTGTTGTSNSDLTQDSSSQTTSGAAAISDWRRNVPFLTDAVDGAFVDDDESTPDDGDSVLGDTSMTTTATKAQQDALVRVTDFAIVHLTMVKNPSLNERYQGYRVAQERVPVIVEGKRFVSRVLEGEAQMASILKRFGEPRTALAIQAALLFRKYPQTESVVAIAAVGPWWCSAKIKPAKNTVSDREFQQAVKKNNQKVVLLTVKTGKWNKPLRLDTRRSDQRFVTIHNNLVKLGVAPVVF